jgi:hypothetical protein
MKQLNRYDFANDRHFAMHLLALGDTLVRNLPRCSVLAFESESPEDGPHYLHLRPDEALILARLLVDAVWQVMEKGEKMWPLPLTGTETSLSIKPSYIDSLCGPKAGPQ